MSGKLQFPGALGELEHRFAHFGEGFGARAAGEDQGAVNVKEDQPDHRIIAFIYFNLNGAGNLL